jgi:hypothetical protein
MQQLKCPDGVVLDRAFVEKTAPSAMHSEEFLEEDDSFLSVGSETWITWSRTTERTIL